MSNLKKLLNGDTYWTETLDEVEEFALNDNIELIESTNILYSAETEYLEYLEFIKYLKG